MDPVINWLIKNRRGAQWSSTRDTAIVVLALNDYLEVSGELEQEVGYEVRVNGQKIAERHISGAELLSAPSRFAIDPEMIRDGTNQIEIRRTDGEAPLYYMIEARFFSLEEPIRAEGYEIFSQREYYRLVPRPTLLNGHVLERIRVKDGDTLTSGERLEVVLRIEAKNNYEYLVFEDLKPAGLEAVALRDRSPGVRKLRPRSCCSPERLRSLPRGARWPPASWTCSATAWPRSRCCPWDLRPRRTTSAQWVGRCSSG